MSSIASPRYHGPNMTKLDGQTNLFDCDVRAGFGRIKVVCVSKKCVLSYTIYYVSEGSQNQAIQTYIFDSFKYSSKISLDFLGGGERQNNYKQIGIFWRQIFSKNIGQKLFC